MSRWVTLIIYSISRENASFIFKQKLNMPKLVIIKFISLLVELIYKHNKKILHLAYTKDKLTNTQMLTFLYC